MTSSWIPNKGKIIYDPHRPDLKKTYKSRCVILEPKTDDLTALVRWFIEKKYGQKLALQAPMWRPHVTVVHPYEKVDQTLYAQAPLNGQLIDFDYSLEVYRHWKFWVLPVRSLKLRELRASYGLQNDNFHLHLTIGREHDWQTLIEKPQQA